MSKAFTREDDGGLSPISTDRASLHASHTPMGRAALQTKLEAALRDEMAAEAARLQLQLASGTVPGPEDRQVASLGAEVSLRGPRGLARIVRLVTADEVGLVDRGASPTSPIGAAVVGARVGDEVELPGGVQLVVESIAWPAPPDAVAIAKDRG